MNCSKEPIRSYRHERIESPLGRAAAEILSGHVVINLIITIDPQIMKVTSAG